MDMQNVSNLQIPEGVVLTIHDKDNRLIWGRLNYDTKYAGDTYQQTYSGKNLFDINSTVVQNFSATSSVISGNLRVTNGYTGSSHSVALKVGNTQDYSGKTLTLKTLWSSSGANTGRMYIGTSDSDGNNRTLLGNIATSGGSVTVTIPTNITSTNNTLIIMAYSNNNSAQIGDYVDYSQTQLEQGSSSSPFEPYTGGVPSPNPDYPQDINVVTGEQTVSITDGTNTQNFTVNLGATELCKIGNYQDYIYKSGDDWYVHKDTGKVIWNGTETWQYDSATTRAATANPTNIKTYYTGDLCTHLVPGGSSSAAQNNVFNVGGSSTFVKATSVLTSANAWKTWLASNNVSLYYALATPNDTQITDTTLINQLNSVHQFLTRYGYNATVSGNLPLIVDRTNL